MTVRIDNNYLITRYQQKGNKLSYSQVTVNMISKVKHSWAIPASKFCELLNISLKIKTNMHTVKALLTATSKLRGSNQSPDEGSSLFLPLPLLSGH